MLASNVILDMKGSPTSRKHSGLDAELRIFSAKERAIRPMGTGAGLVKHTSSGLEQSVIRESACGLSQAGYLCTVFYLTIMVGGSGGGGEYPLVSQPVELIQRMRFLLHIRFIFRFVGPLGLFTCACTSQHNREIIKH